METKMVKVPFNIELAKQITNGEKEGRIIDIYYNCNVRIVDFNFKTVQGDFCIGVSEVAENQEVYAIIDKDGYIFDSHTNKKEDKITMMLEVPEYTQFKDGDILCCVCGPFMYNGNYKVDDRIHYGAHCGINSLGKLNIEGDRYIAKDNSSWSSDKVWYVTEKERQQLIDGLKQSTDPRAKNCLKMLGIE